MSGAAGRAAAIFFRYLDIYICWGVSEWCGIVSGLSGRNLCLVQVAGTNICIGK